MILLYHKVDQTAPTTWWVTADRFFEQMHALQDRTVVLLDEYDPVNRNHVSITFDGVYANVLRYAAPILRQFEYPFELFVTSDYIGQDNRFDSIEPRTQFATRQELLTLREFGGRLQWHTRSHAKLVADSRSRDWGRTVRELEIPSEIRELDPEGFKWFAYPHGDYGAAVYEEVKKRFKGAVSCVQGASHDRFALNRLTVTNETNLRKQSISCIVVSHNYGNFLSEAVESVLRQTARPDEILIMDDGSADNTAQIGSKYAKLYPDLIRFERNERNLGIVGTFNKAVSMSQGDLIVFLGADNRMPSNYVAECSGRLYREGSGTGVVYTDFALFGNRAKDEYLLQPAERHGRILCSEVYEIVFPDFEPHRRREGNFIHGSSMYRRTAFDKAGGYVDRLARPEDADLFGRMLSAGFTAAKARETFLEYRQHSADQANVANRTAGELAFYRAYARRMEFKVKALEKSFGLLSPLVKALSSLERAAWELTIKLLKLYRRRFR